MKRFQPVKSTAICALFVWRIVNFHVGFQVGGTFELCIVLPITIEDHMFLIFHRGMSGDVAKLVSTFLTFQTGIDVATFHEYE